MTAVLDEPEFDRLAHATLRRIEDAFVDVDPDQIDVSASDGVVRLTLANGTRIVINSHRAARQIWMAAVATAWHFDPTASGAWLAPKTGEDLGETLAKLVKTHTGVMVTI